MARLLRFAAQAAAIVENSAEANSLRRADSLLELRHHPTCKAACDQCAKNNANQHCRCVTCGDKDNLSCC